QCRAAQRSNPPERVGNDHAIRAIGQRDALAPTWPKVEAAQRLPRATVGLLVTRDRDPPTLRGNPVQRVGCAIGTTGPTREDFVASAGAVRGERPEHGCIAGAGGPKEVVRPGEAR